MLLIYSVARQNHCYASINCGEGLLPRRLLDRLQELLYLAFGVLLGGAHPLTLDIDATLRAAREIHAIREELEANQAALDEALIAPAALRASITRLDQLACALVALVVALVAAIVFKR